MAGWDYATNAASGIRDVALETWDKMEVNVEYGLTSGLANIDSEIEPIGPVLANQPRAGFIRKCQQVAAFLRHRFEPIRNVAARDE